MSANTLGSRIELARVAKGYNQNQLARRLSVKAATLKSWENDNSEPRANKINMLAGVLGVPLYWLMTGKGDGIDEDEHLIGTANLQQKLTQAQAVSQRLTVILHELEGDVMRLQRRLDEENDGLAA